MLTTGSLSREINTIGEKDTFFAAYPVEGDSVSVDCSGTSDEKAATVKFDIDTDYDPLAPQWVPLAGSIVLDAGRKPMAIRAEDESGLKTIKTFAIDSQCIDGETPVIDVGDVNISTAGKHNFYNYSAAGAVTGGSDFQYAWDFNGDGVFDPFPLTEAGSVWISSAAANNVYSIFASAGSHRRQAFLRVRNGCNLESETVLVEMPDEMPNIARTPTSQAEKKGYYYLQADISLIGTQPTAPSLNQRTNGPYLATQYPGDNPKRVICDYQFTKVAGKGQFNIQGFNWYQGSNRIDTANEFLHGMEIKIASIPDNGGSAPQTYNSSSNGVVLSHSLYRVSASDDGIVKEVYTKNAACTVEITIERGEAVTPCTSNTDQVEFTPATATILYGEFNCPNLRNSSTGTSVAAENGKFFCEVAPVDQCVGGGGGGGGGIPPTPQ
ncbi:MAG: hypothetical protein IT288_13680 [Bdellovibrionales bacterium]|nr:hypothetical protein [Bdellovibrionales bacterium]